MTAPLPFEARNAVYTQRIVNRTVEATAPDGIELLTKHVFQDKPLNRRLASQDRYDTQALRELLGQST